MRQNEPRNHVRFAATAALLNSMEFTQANFVKEVKGNYIMEVVCEATCCGDIYVRVAALQCLVKMISLYQQYMEPYMGRALFPIALEAMKCDHDEVASQDIKFWSNKSAEEVDLAIEGSEAVQAGRPPSRCTKLYAKGALQYMCPVLMQKLTKHEKFDNTDDGNPSKAAGVCLMLLATCCKDDIFHMCCHFFVKISLVKMVSEGKRILHFFSHPYNFELDCFTPPHDQLKVLEPPPVKSVDGVPLAMIERHEQIPPLMGNVFKCLRYTVDLKHYSHGKFPGFTCLMQIPTKEKDYLVDTLSLCSDKHVLFVATPKF